MIVKAFDKVIETEENTPLVLEVTVTGNTQPKVTWVKDRKTLEESDQLKITSEALSNNQVLHRLTIASALNTDAGAYTAKAKNPLGEVSCATKVEILYKPVFTKELAPEISVKEHDTVKFTTEVNANPKADISWYKKTESEEVKITNDAKFKADEQKLTANLTLKDALLKDAETYVVIAKNKCGESRCECKLSIGVPPKFFKTPDASTEVEIGNGFTTSCVLRGLPLPDIKFVNNEDKSEVQATEDGSVEIKSNKIGDTEVEFTLSIKAVGETTPTSMECVAFNSIGKAASKVEIKKTRKPVLVKKPEEVMSLQIGKDVVLECTVLAAPNATISWFKDSKKLSASKRLLIAEVKEATPVANQKTYSFKIISATKEDSGVYEVVAVNKLGEARASSDLTIEFAPIITKDLKPKEKAVEDNTFKYEVSAKGCPKPTIAWFNEETEISATNEEFTTKNENEVYSLTIKRIRDTSAGRYKAVASNELGMAQSVISELDVDLKPKITALFTTVEPLKHDLIENEAATVSLEFKIEGKPVPSVSLAKDEIVFKASEKRITLAKTDVENVYKLSIPDLKTSDGGVYKINAKNTTATTSFFIDLKIRAAPKLVKVLKTKMDCIESNKVELICSIAPGIYPVPECKWFCNDELIDANDTKNFVQLNNDKAGNSLVIENVQLWMDNANFKFLCTNELGSVDSQTTLEVFSVPVFTVGITEAEPYLNQPFAWDFELDANPEPKLKVIRNDKEINVSRESHMKLTSVSEMKETRRITKYRLEFEQTIGEDLGFYKIEASNKAGSALTSAQLTVKGGPCFIRKPQDASFLVGKPLKNEFEISGIPDPEMVWLKDGAPLVPTDRVKIESRGKSIWWLSIKTCSKEDFGVYTIKLSNENGTAEESFTLSMQSELIYLIFELQDVLF